MFFSATKVTPLDNYVLRLTFKNGEEMIFDMKPYLHTGVFKSLKNETIFKSAKVSFDTVAWNNEADIDPETWYHEGVSV